MAAAAEDLPRCSWCGEPLVVVRVHGHGQCSRCGTNVDPCCAGASAQAEALEGRSDGKRLDPNLLPRLFAELGGLRATLTEEALVFALCRDLDCDVDEARMVLDAARDLGVIAREDGRVQLRGNAGA